jgi:hypothetical protein
VSTADQFLLARISGVCSRHCARGKIDDLDAAVAELRELAGHHRTSWPSTLACPSGSPRKAWRSWYRSTVPRPLYASLQVLTRRQYRSGPRLAVSELSKRG